MPANHANLKVKNFDISERQKYVAELFDDLAPKYDRFNRWVSLFRDEAWRKHTVQLLHECSRGIVLDLAAGTGDLAQAALVAGARRVHVFDISFEMLSMAKLKLNRSQHSSNRFAFEQGSANALPFSNQSIDGMVSGFAVRNVFHFLDDVLSEVYRVLKPGGRFAILELSQPTNPLLKFGFQMHMKAVMPIIGTLIAGKSAPFKYLYQTTMTFYEPAQFADKLTKAGFQGVQFKKYLLGGIAIHSGHKP